MTRCVILLCAATLAGCGTVAKIDARQHYQSSVAAYKECLARNMAAPRNCEVARLTMDADEREYTNLSAGLHPGSQSNVTILSR